MYLKVYFPSGRYYAAESHTPHAPEWPPHPSRIFSAFVAAAYSSGCGLTDAMRRVLKWFETLPAPSIAAPEADITDSPKTYVPPGDVSGRKGKRGEEEYEHGVHRWRQERHFPHTVILGDPVVCYGWEQDPAPDLLATFQQLASAVTHVGTSHSMAIVTPEPGRMPQVATHIPSGTGSHFIRVPIEGRLEELDEVFKHRSGVRRPQPVCERFEPYRVNGRFERGKADDSSELIAHRISGSMHGADTGAYLARSIRRAVMSVLGDNAPPAVHGHSKARHVGWLPLPDVGHAYARGRIVGVGIMIPGGLTMEERRQILSGIGRVKDIRLQDGRIARLHPPSPGEPLPVALKAATWTQASKIWASVTPVVLDRPPKRLREGKLKKAISESLELAGFPKPAGVEVSAFSLFQGAPPAFRVPAKKPRYHAVLHFDTPVSGPVIAGRMRYFGIGLFRPVRAN